MNFRDIYSKNEDNYLIVTVDDSSIKKLKAFVKKIVKIKMREDGYRTDNSKLEKRFYTGYLAEMAFEQALGIKITDLSIGNSFKYNIADLEAIGLNVGIKAVEFGKFPIVHKNPKRPEVICIVLDERTVAICGIANEKILKKYSSDKLIIDPNLRKKGTKTGFFGLDKLEYFK